MMLQAASILIQKKFSRQIFVGFFFYCEKIRHIVIVTKKLINERGNLYDKLY